MLYEVITFLLSQADAADNPLAQYACLRAARSGAAENRLLLAQLKVIHPASARMVAPPYAESELEHRFAAAANLSRIFEVHIEADERMLDQVRETGSRLERTTDFTADIV